MEMIFSSGEKPKWLECIYCDKEFGLGDEFLAHIGTWDEEDLADIDCCVCINCYEKEPEEIKNAKAKKGGWAMMVRELDGYSFVVDKANL